MKKFLTRFMLAIGRVGFSTELVRNSIIQYMPESGSAVALAILHGDNFSSNTAEVCHMLASGYTISTLSFEMVGSFTVP